MNEFLNMLSKIHGPIRKFDDLGRIVVPKEMRDALDINTGKEIEILIIDDYIMLKPLKEENESKEIEI